ncbi:MAG TPA: VOC family protein [Anaerolineae bacterium]
MAEKIKTGGADHAALTVTDVARSVRFYTDLLGFQQVADLGWRVLLHNGSFILAVGRPPDPSRAVAGDRFDENRVGLDHLSLSVGGQAELEAARRTLTAAGVPYGEIEDLGGGLHAFALRDPDNIQIELSAAYAA